MSERSVIVVLFWFCAMLVGAQEKNKSRSIQILNADNLSYDKEKNNARVLRGNVRCEHEGAILHCDTALIYEAENKMVARGNILITKGDSIRVTGDNLVYDGK